MQFLVSRNCPAFRQSVKIMNLIAIDRGFVWTVRSFDLCSQKAGSVSRDFDAIWTSLLLFETLDRLNSNRLKLFVRYRNEAKECPLHHDISLPLLELFWGHFSMLWSGNSENLSPLFSGWLRSKYSNRQRLSKFESSKIAWMFRLVTACLFRCTQAELEVRVWLILCLDGS
jgi:hypothetical protein